MITQKISSKGVEFINKTQRGLVPFEQWKETDDVISYLPLAELLENSFASISNDGIVVPFESLYHFSQDDIIILGLPEPFPYKVKLKCDSTLDSNELRYKLVCSNKKGDYIRCSRTANIMHAEGKDYLLSYPQYLLFNKVDSYNNLEQTDKNRQTNLRYFSEIKKLTQEAECKIDEYIEEENVFTPENIKLNVNISEDGLSITPSVDHCDNKQFVETFNRFHEARDVYPIQGKTGKTLFLFDNEQKEGLDEIKVNSSKIKSRSDLRRIIEKPTEYFDPDVFDLDEFFSERVIEYGLYKPRFYPFVSPYKSCWIAGATIEDNTNGTTQIQFENEEQLADFETQIELAENNNDFMVSYQDAEIDIDDAKALAKLAHKQFETPDKPVCDDCEGRKVLIIEENAEDLGYSADTSVPEVVDKYTLFVNDYLKPQYPLKPHQEEGVAWLQHLYNSYASGCLVADDMGLGKTLQILYFIDWHSRQNNDHKPYLIVAPVSLLENWESEYRKFFSTPRLDVCVLNGSDVPRKFNKEIISFLAQKDIILTNYETMRNAQLNFCAVDFEIVVLDEAQRIKTPGTLVTNAAKALKAKFKIALTGTPVENSLLDLWCIMDFCVPGLLGNARSFSAKYQAPLKRENTDLDALGQRIHETLGQFMIRRMKADVAKDLPKKIESHHRNNMPKFQQEVYNGVVRRYNEGITSNMLETITYMREVSEHPLLFKKTLLQHAVNDMISTSARLQTTIEILDSIRAKDEKVILFAERKDTQRMLQLVVLEKYGLRCSIINGDTPTTDNRSRHHIEYSDSDRFAKMTRQKTIDAFQRTNGFNVIIMSPVAAGMGLNVTAANHVIHYSRHWNPAKENQATDRAYRIGQTKDVYVYYPMAISQTYKSFDDTLDELLSRKSLLASSAIFPTEQMEVRKEELYNALLKA